MQGRRIEDFFSRDRKTLYMILSIVLISIFSLTIVYAALSVTLNITGNAEVVSSSWDIHLDNVSVKSGSVSGTTPSITSPTTATFSTTLTTPGDFYEFTIDVVNDGSIDAMIDSVSKTPTLTTEQAKYLKYEVSYANGESINTKQLVSKNSFVRLKVRVEYRKDVTASDLPATSETLNLAFTVNYIQSDGSGSSIIDNGIYDPYKIGNEICFDAECFYVMYSDDDTVTMLAKYNLYVGGEYNNSWTAYGDEATGKQDSTMIGYRTTPMKGVTRFSDAYYWGNAESTYSTYVYDSNSVLYSYVENYKTYLSTLGVTPVEARLITKEELETLGCSGSSCKTAPSWVYTTSYWSGSKGSVLRSLCIVDSDGHFDSSFFNVANFGCRPVIVIDRVLIDGTDSSAKTLIEFTIEKNTYQAEEGMTWGEWVGSEYNTGGYVINSYGYISHRDDISEYMWIHLSDTNGYEYKTVTIVSDGKYIMISTPV